MESYLRENFRAELAKNSSEEALRRWRGVVGIVKNPKRRFCFTANLDKPGEAEAIKHANHAPLSVSVLVSKCALQFIHSVSSSRPLIPLLIPCSQWEKGECIGCGSFGQVYRGFNREHGQFCAIKEVLIILNDPRSKEQVKQLNQEICLLKQWSHPNIVRYYGSIITDYALSIYMEYASMGSIHGLLANFGPFKESLIRSYTEQILSGLAFLHKKKHIHRDIKGANILVGPNDEVKLADFGLAKHISSLTEVHSSNKGTIYWMAPEVILSTHSCKGYNLSADIWSLGCTVIEMATGKPPLHHLEPVAAMYKIANDAYMPEIPDNISDAVKDFLQRCLQRDPACRPSAAALLDHPFIQNQGMSFLESNTGRPLSFNEIFRKCLKICYKNPKVGFIILACMTLLLALILSKP